MIQRTTIPIMLACLLLIFAVGPLQTVSATSEDCFKGDLEYTNTSGSEQTIYVTLFDSNLGKPVGSSKAVGTVAPGETIDQTIKLDAPDDDHNFIYSTSPIDPNSPMWFGGSTIDPCAVFTDGRLNWTDAAAPAILYNVNNTYYDIYAVNPDNGIGTRVLRVPFTSVIDTVQKAISDGQNLVIQQAVGITVYALSAGTCQMNVFQQDGKLYEFEWPCVPETSATETGS